MPTHPTYSDNVFINCPFDPEYESLFRATVFTIYRCGFYPRCAKEEDDGTDFRLNKILNIVSDCKYGIHDISRIELDKNGFPRFNMPFELGLYWGAKRYGDSSHKSKKAIVLEKNQYSYQKYISDLNGIDTKAHANNINTLISILRNWLNQVSRRTTIPGHLKIIADYEAFNDQLPPMLVTSGLEIENLTFNDLCIHIEEWLKIKIENE